MRPTRALLATLALAAVPAFATACYQDPNRQLDEMQRTLDLSNTLDELRMATAELRGSLDSIRVIVARQDTTIATLANLAGVRYVR
jgi:hypothetical protein